ncbi:uncharacterized protein [Euphorbia lathyris]|uniref:uncharacterized protein isoform X2 n=1 Tax=Euphorbia lathyris TaxID=212925 RepID=UPI0033137D72
MASFEDEEVSSDSSPRSPVRSVAGKSSVEGPIPAQVLPIPSNRPPTQSQKKKHNSQVPPVDFSSLHTDNKISFQYQLTTADNPGVSLVTVPLDEKNYVSWTRAIILALSTKEKLNYILCDDFQPTQGSLMYSHWKRVDSMVISWILNSIARDLVEAFIFTTSARELWKELEQRFGASNGPLLYQLKREISDFKQGHEKESCFKLHNKAKANAVSAQFETPMDNFDEGTHTNLPPGFAEYVQKEIQKVMKGKGSTEYAGNQSHSFSGFSGYAGPSL